MIDLTGARRGLASRDYLHGLANGLADFERNDISAWFKGVINVLESEGLDTSAEAAH